MTFWRTLFDRQSKPQKPYYPVSPVAVPVTTTVTVAAAPIPVAPVLTVNPSISGTSLVGQTLTAAHGTYTGTVTGYSGQWYSGASAIALATGLNYVQQNSDLGNNITYKESAYNTSPTYSSATGTSNALGPVTSAGGLAAPTLGYPSPIASNPATLAVHIPVDWQSGDVLKLARSASSAMTSPTILTHTLTDTDITNGTFSIGLSGVTLAGVTYFQAYGSHAGVDSTNVSGIVAWGDTTAPVITTAATLSTTEQTQLAITLTATDTGGVPALVSDGASPGWYISGGADRLQFQIAVVAGVPTLQLYNNGTETYLSPANNPPNAANPYNVQITAVDYSGNQSTPLSEAVTFTQIDTSPTSFTFTTVNNAALSTLETSNTVTIAGLQAGFNISSSLSGTGFTYSKNGGAYQAPGSFTVANGDTLTLQATSPSANNLTESCTVTVGTYSTTWTISTPITTTTFDPSGLAGNLTLSNGNLTATHAGTTIGGVKTVNTYSSGKYVVRLHVDTTGGGYGWEAPSEPNNNTPSAASQIFLDSGGTLWIGSGFVGGANAFGSRTNGDTVDLAVDLTNKKLWLRINTTWQGAGGDPTASGAGFDLSSLTATSFNPFYLSNVAGSAATLQAVTVTGFTSVI